MQKKLIALAVATLASGALFAQSNVTVYGTIDVGFAHRGDGSSFDDDADAKNPSSQNAINSGQADTSKIGFTGVEDLGNGLKALFVLEAGFHADDGKIDDQLFSEQAFLGLTGGFGTAIAGRLVAPRHGFLAAIDPFAAGTVGQYRNVYNDVGFHGGAVDYVNNRIGQNGVYAQLLDEDLSILALADVDRVDNAVAYVSPSFGGFNITAAYATNAVNQEGNGIGYGGTVDNDGDAKVFTILPRYTNGPLDVGVVYQRIKVKDALPGLDALAQNLNSGRVDADAKVTQWAVGGTYDFKVVKLGAYYDRYKGKLNIDPLTGAVAGALPAIANGYDATETLKTWLIGATVPFGKHAIQVSYSQSKFDTDEVGVSAGKAKQWALGYTYALSKRTNFYAAYSDISNDNEKGKKDNKVQRTATTGDASNGAAYDNGGYQNGIQFGLKHTF